MSTTISVGIDYCTVHLGTRNEDDPPYCDWSVRDADEHTCPACDGAGEVNEATDEWEDCPACEGQGVTPCALVPLIYVTEGEA